MMPTESIPSGLHLVPTPTRKVTSASAGITALSWENGSHSAPERPAVQTRPIDSHLALVNRGHLRVFEEKCRVDYRKSTLH